MNRAFTTNWYIYRAYLPLRPGASEAQLQPSEEVPILEETPRLDFEKLLLEAVDEGLSSLGDSPKQAIYLYLEKAFRIKKTDIPDKIDEFTNAIEKIFGHGAKHLEIQIMKRLYEKIGHISKCFEMDDLLFTEYIEACMHATM